MYKPPKLARQVEQRERHRVLGVIALELQIRTLVLCISFFRPELLHLPASPWTMAAAHKAGDGPRFTVRPFRAGDSPEARRIFSEGLLDQPCPAFRGALLSPTAPCLLLAVGAAVYVASRSMAWAALPVAALLALLYLACRMVYTNYLREMLEVDMADIEGTYMGRPGAGFWVVEEQGGDGGLRGVVAVQAAEGQPGCCQLLRLAVDRRCRGLGLGRRLTRHVLEFARENGYRECVLDTTTVQHRAIMLYQAQGFRVTRDKVPLPGQPLLSLVTNIYLCEMSLYPLDAGNHH
ncbi:N-acetyltransferase 8-like [Amblyraja radiata]|uniref:N-acetyltransferase 8-like n=1 Tax=Amblyraja radiata TaxID=386614 RepID=UPI0014038F13|nr:N-acetyltransferase 8-like [Amblyraja radiata]